jgi:hypothetical protein
MNLPYATRAWIGIIFCWALPTSDIRAQAYAPEFSDELLASRKPVYDEGIRFNYENVIAPRLTPDENSQLAGLEIQLPSRIPNADPLGFATDGRAVFMSVASIRFFAEISNVAAWLQLNGYTLESLTNYALMLRHRRFPAPPPAPMAALCVTPEVASEPRVDELAGKIFSNMLVFILLHEMGHIVHGHLQDDGSDMARERAQEQQADDFALDMMGRIGDPPLGIVPFFVFTAHAAAGRGDFNDDLAYQRYLESQSHPVDAERLQALAESVREKAATYAPTLAQGKLGFEKVALEIASVAMILADEDAQRLMRAIGHTATEANLAPLLASQKLGAPCAQHAPLGEGPFAGYYGGTFVGDGTSFDANAVIRHRGEQVTGDLSYGAGTTTLAGEPLEQTLRFSWSQGDTQGHGVMNLLEAGALGGTWGYGESETDGGTVELKRMPRAD